MNPHPTKSKPAKIGRKHLGKPSTRISDKRRAGRANAERQKIIKHRAYKAKVAAWWRGELETYPKKPQVVIQPHAPKWRRPKPAPTA